MQGGLPRSEGMDARGDGDGVRCVVGWPGWLGGVTQHQQLSAFRGLERGGADRQGLQYSGISWLFIRLMSLQVTLICWAV